MSKKGSERSVTEQYSMELLRGIKVLEDKYLRELGRLFGCDELDVPVEIDVLSLISKDSAQRKRILEAIFSDAPPGKTEIMNNLLRDISELEETQVAPGKHK